MASPNSKWTELVVTTLDRRRRVIADNVSLHNALLMRLKQQANGFDPAPGGRTLVEELRYKANSTFKWYEGYELIDITPQSTHSAAEYAWKQAAASVSISGGEMAMNAGPDQMIPLIRARTEGAESDMNDGVGGAVYSDGTGDGGKELGGSQLLIADDPTSGVVGGIDRANFSFWRNYTKDVGGAFSNTTIGGFMRTAWLNLVRGSDKPNLIVGDSNSFEAYWESLTEIQRLNDPNRGASGFRSLEFMGPGGSAPVLFDDRTPIDHMYFYNTKYIKYRPHRDRNMITTDQRTSINQDAVVVILLFMGNLTLSNASLQGVLFNGS